MVYLNGDTALPGCAKCSGKIDIQRFLTEVSVDAGTEPGSASASFSLSIPLHHTDSFARDAKFLLKPGLEVHVYMRGYFPVAGLYSHLAEGRLQNEIEGSALAPNPKIVKSTDTGSKANQPRKPNGTAYAQADFERRKKATSSVVVKRLKTLVAMTETLHQYLEQQGFQGVEIKVADGYTPPKGHVKGSSHYTGKAFDFKAYDSQGEIDRTVVWASMQKLLESGHLPNRLGTGVYLKPGQTPNPNPEWSGSHHMDFGHAEGGYTWVWVGGKAQKGRTRTAWLKALKPRIAELPAPNASVGSYKQNLAGKYPGDAPDMKPTDGLESPPIEAATLAKSGTAGPSLLEEYGLQGMGIENTLAYPYYHVFHGVVTEVSHSYSGGVNSVSVNCSSMLHFWQYQNMSTNASVFGARPRNSKLKMSLVGHNFTGMHPYQIMYTLHHDMVGAAGGVGWALSSKSNQTAVSEVGQESLFSLNIRYWERRFSGRIIRLRMHGATGELFSTMASAWLGRTSSARIMSLIRRRYNTDLNWDSPTGILAESMAVGLMRKGKRQALEATKVGVSAGEVKASNTPSFELNMVEMQAFVSNIGNWGQINLFESSYESKLDVAQKVMEITGFEFYQDVDGDFVFKPPMWNLDTSSSRVYRIEDIDIIDISFSEKEPQVTYMTCKGSHFKNLGGTGLENEWGVRGQYIDYRLVAQFGWRPGTYETAYFNDSKSMFFSAVNRMDVMNIGINSASVTIPVRPELRPGFPVYIPYLDCFYYCNSFAHSHAVGGQCTTSLQLVGKRAKFYAPGRRGPSATGKSTIDNIDLSNTALPQCPLLVQNEGGKPRLSGFPNVVMALDPDAINPLFFVVGNDMLDLSDTRTIRSLLDFGAKQGVLQGPREMENGAKVYTLISKREATEDRETFPVEVLFYFQESDFYGTGEAGVEAGDTVGVYAFNIIKEAIAYEKLAKQAALKGKSSQETVDAINRQIIDWQAQKADLLAGEKPEKPKALAKWEKTIANLTKQILEAEEKLEDTVDQINSAKRALEASYRTSTDPKMLGIAFLLEMLDQIGSKFRASADFQGREDLSSTVNLLDMLSDKKAIFSNGTQPGSYRYYSASHPDKEHQAPARVEYATEAKKRVVTLPPAPLEDPVAEISMYTKSPRSKFPGATEPEAELVKGKPEVGIKVLNSNKNKPGGEALPTSEILELMFSVQPVTIVKSVTRVVRTTNIGTLGAAAGGKIEGQFTTSAVGRSPALNESVEDFFGEQWASLQTSVKQGIEAMKSKADETYGVPLSVESPSFPATVQVYKLKLATTTPVGTVKGEASLGAEGSKADVPTILNRAGQGLGSIFNKGVVGIRRKVAKAMAAAGKSEGYDDVIGVFNDHFGSTLGVAIAASNTRKSSGTQKRTTTTFSPVFPVSDALGYEVVGTNRYGRGVDIEPKGVFDQMHKKDVFSLLDKHLVEQILRFFIQNKGSVVVPEMATTEVNGVKKTGPLVDTQTLKGGAAAKYINDEVVRQLRARNLTDKQILDYGFLLNSDGDKGLLQFSLANIFADQNLDGVVKVPVINAAYSLADMNVQQSGHICDCKAAEADVEILAFGQKQFLSFTQSGTPHHEGLGGDPADAGTRWVAMQAAQAADLWRQQQQALRGQVLDRGGSPIVQAFKDFGAAVTTGVEESYEQIQARLDAAAKKASVDWQNVKTAPEDDQ